MAETSDYVGVFRIECQGEEAALADAYSNLIQNDDGVPLFRLVALVNVTAHGKAEREALKERIREKDTLLKEIQHRVKNNLQMITALIRLEARNARGDTATAPFDRLAGRIEALQFLYESLSADAKGDEIDLGVYLSQIASGVMRSHAGGGNSLGSKGGCLSGVGECRHANGTGCQRTPDQLAEACLCRPRGWHNHVAQHRRQQRLPGDRLPTTALDFLRASNGLSAASSEPWWLNRYARMRRRT